MPAKRTSRSSASSSTAAAHSSSSPRSAANKRVPLASKGSGGKRPLVQRTTQDEAPAVDAESEEMRQDTIVEMHVAAATAHARNVASLLRPSDSPESRTLYLTALAARFATLTAQGSTRASRRTSVTPALGADEEAGEVDEQGTRVDWEAFRNDPEGIVAEEEAVLEYFKKLKFIHLELDTKRIFLEETLGRMGDRVHSAQAVAAFEEAAVNNKAQMKAAKATIRSLRAEIDALCLSLLPSAGAPPTPSKSSRRSAKAKPTEPGAVAAMQADAEEAQALLREIGDAELELARLKAGAGARPLPGTAIPPKGSLTHEEAVDWSEAQMEEIQELEDAYAAMQAHVEARKRELHDGLRAVERLGVEHNIAETYAAEARKVGVEGTRDLSVEKECTEHKAKESILRTIVGLRTISAPDATTLRAVYEYGAPPDGQEHDRAVLVITYAAPGGRIASYSLQGEDGADLLALHAPSGSWTREAFEVAKRANETSGIVQAAMACLVATHHA